MLSGMDWRRWCVARTTLRDTARLFALMVKRARSSANATAVIGIWSSFLNTIEIMGEEGGAPEVACAAPEDIADSADRLHEILEIYR